MAFAVALPGASGIVSGTGASSNVNTGTYIGCSIAETAGTPGLGKVRIHEGGTSSGKVIDVVALLASTHTHHSPAQPIFYTGQLYVEIVTGTVEGVLFLA